LWVVKLITCIIDDLHTKSATISYIILQIQKWSGLNCIPPICLLIIISYIEIENISKIIPRSADIGFQVTIYEEGLLCLCQSALFYTQLHTHCGRRLRAIDSVFLFCEPPNKSDPVSWVFEQTSFTNLPEELSKAIPKYNKSTTISHSCSGVLLCIVHRRRTQALFQQEGTKRLLRDSAPLLHNQEKSLRIKVNEKGNVSRERNCNCSLLVFHLLLCQSEEFCDEIWIHIHGRDYQKRFLGAKVLAWTVSECKSGRMDNILLATLA
jgi:hypothetical protein